MPLFKRPDGVLVRDESNVRLMMPYIMRGRNESAVYHAQDYDLTKTRAWISKYNRAHAQPITLFHLFMWGVSRAIWDRPRLNRFISGGRIYDRKGLQVAFSAKKKLDDGSPLVTVKVPFYPDEPFADFVRRVLDGIEKARSDAASRVDKELKLAMALPGFLLRAVMATLRWLDRVNLMPASMIDPDPMYATLFVANLGSIGLDQTFHHLYEYGTISLFAALGLPQRATVVGPDRQPTVRQSWQVRWTLDERVADGFYCAATLRMVREIVEDPEKYLGAPTANANREQVVPIAAARPKPAAAAAAGREAETVTAGEEVKVGGHAGS